MYIFSFFAVSYDSAGSSSGGGLDLESLGPLALLIAPLAALAALGLAAYLAANPVLLQLAVINNNTGRK